MHFAGRILSHHKWRSLVHSSRRRKLSEQSDNACFSMHTLMMKWGMEGSALMDSARGEVARSLTRQSQVRQTR